MTTDLVTVQVTDSQEESAELLSKYDLIAIPVQDEDGRLLGIITFDDVMDVLEEEATDDFHKMGSVSLVMSVAVSSIGYYRGGVEVATSESVIMIIVVLFGSLVGMSLPFGLQRLNLDPATASAPLVTSFAEIGSMLIYLTLATWYLGL